MEVHGMGRDTLQPDAVWAFLEEVCALCLSVAFWDVRHGVLKLCVSCCFSSLPPSTYDIGSATKLKFTLLRALANFQFEKFQGPSLRVLINVNPTNDIA